MTLDEEVRRASRLLETAIQAAGVSPEEVERSLDAAPGYLGRLLTGEIELKLRHILAILRRLEIDPSVFFQSLFPASDPPEGRVELPEMEERIRRLGLGESTAPPPPEEPDLERLVRQAVRTALSRREPV